jgi:hypothetical protein
MALPYESATSGEKALAEIQKILSRFGCQQFGHMVDNEAHEIRLMFKWQGRQISLPASISGYAAAWLREHPYSHRMQRSRVEHERKAMEIARIAVFSMLRDWIKGQVTAVEVGILSFEGAFLGQIMLPGKNCTVLDYVKFNNMLQLEDKSDHAN